MTEQEILDYLSEANVVTNEIADDIAKLIAKEPALKPETKAAFAAHIERLKGVASQYTEETGGEDGEDTPTV